MHRFTNPNRSNAGCTRGCGDFRMKGWVVGSAVGLMGGWAGWLWVGEAFAGSDNRLAAQRNAFASAKRKARDMVGGRGCCVYM